MEKKVGDKVVYSFEEVCKHNKPGDCWVIISGKVYDVSQFLDDHPGGENALLTSTGKDATVDFGDVRHSADAIKKRENFVIGLIDESTLPPEVEDFEQYMRRRNAAAASSLSNTASYYWLFVLPLFIIGVASFFRIYLLENK